MPIKKTVLALLSACMFGTATLSCFAIASAITNVENTNIKVVENESNDYGIDLALYIGDIIEVV